MSKTYDDLKTAFAGESQANRRYLAYAKAAEQEGKPNLARLFRVAAESETVHALNHFAASGEARDSVANLDAAIAGESYEIETMYPGFIADAEIENESKAKLSFRNANEVEKTHKDLFLMAKERAVAGEDVLTEEYYVCGVCGYPASGEAPEKCPVCGSPREKFYRVG